MRDAVILAVVLSLCAAVLTWLWREPEALAVPCAGQCGAGWRGVEFAGGCACVQEVR